MQDPLPALDLPQECPRRSVPGVQIKLASKLAEGPFRLSSRPSQHSQVEMGIRDARVPGQGLPQIAFSLGVTPGSQVEGGPEDQSLRPPRVEGQSLRDQLQSLGLPALAKPELGLFEEGPLGSRMDQVLRQSDELGFRPQEDHGQRIAIDFKPALRPADPGHQIPLEARAQDQTDFVTLQDVLPMSPTDQQRTEPGTLQGPDPRLAELDCQRLGVSLLRIDRVGPPVDEDAMLGPCRPLDRKSVV